MLQSYLDEGGDARGAAAQKKAAMLGFLDKAVQERIFAHDGWLQMARAAHREFYDNDSAAGKDNMRRDEIIL